MHVINAIGDVVKKSLGPLALLGMTACGSLPPPEDLATYKSLAENEETMSRVQEVAPDDYERAQGYADKAKEACADQDELECQQYSTMAKISLQAGLEKLAIKEANARKAKAQEELQTAQKVEREQLALKKDYDSRISRMKRIASLKDSLSSAKNQKEAKVAELKLKMEQQKLSEQQAHAAYQAKQEQYQQQKAKLDVIMDRNSLFEAAMGIVGKENVKQTYRGIIVTVRGLFPPGKTDVLEEKQVLVNQLAQLAAAHKRYPIVVEGHTDSRGAGPANLALSQARAQAVMNEMIPVKVDPSRIKAIGFGENRPMTDNATKEGRAANRRIDVAFLFVDQPLEDKEAASSKGEGSSGAKTGKSATE